MAKAKRSNSDHEQLLQTVQMFEVIAETQPNDIQSLEILKEAYIGLERDQDAVGISKKIAQAYVNLGQFSSAILEFEGILQRYPEDAESLTALGELEAKMSGLASNPTSDAATKSAAAEKALAQADQFEDGNEALAKFFTENSVFSEKDAKNVLSGLAAAIAQTPADRPQPSLLGLISERGIASMEKCLGVITEKTRLPFLPIAFYDIDPNKASQLEKDFCLKHLVLPFDQLSKTLLVATANPFDARAKHRVESETECRVQWYVCHPQEITKQLRDIFHIQS